MVTILVLGGTGPTGQALIKEAIVRKYTVVIFARSPQKLPEEISLHPLVIVVSGYLEDEGAVRKAFTVPCRTGRNDKHSDEHGGAAECTHTTEIHIDAVVSALGPPVMKIHPSGHPIAKGYERVVRIGKEYGVSRFIVLGTASITDSADRFDARFKALVLGFVKCSILLVLHPRLHQKILNHFQSANLCSACLRRSRGNRKGVRSS